jgi:hypothetical protein
MDNKYLGYYIQKHNPAKKVILKTNDDIDICDMGIIELALPKCRRVWCWNNELSSLIVPEGCELINCSHNNLKELIIPKSCKYIYCFNNELSSLIVPEGEYISCCDNKLHPIIIELFNSDDPIKIQLANNMQLAKK